jgi:hypothetical protein
MAIWSISLRHFGSVTAKCRMALTRVMAQIIEVALACAEPAPQLVSVEYQLRASMSAERSLPTQPPRAR